MCVCGGGGGGGGGGVTGYTHTHTHTHNFFYFFYFLFFLKSIYIFFFYHTSPIYNCRGSCNSATGHPDVQDKQKQRRPIIVSVIGMFGTVFAGMPTLRLGRLIRGCFVGDLGAADSLPQTRTPVIAVHLRMKTINPERWPGGYRLCFSFSETVNDAVVEILVSIIDTRGITFTF